MWNSSKMCLLNTLKLFYVTMHSIKDSLSLISSSWIFVQISRFLYNVLIYILRMIYFLSSRLPSLLQFNNHLLSSCNNHVLIVCSLCILKWQTLRTHLHLLFVLYLYLTMQLYWDREVSPLYSWCNHSLYCRYRTKN